jgi:glycine/D-amino acid oxidase-like deaminating enzyme
VSSVTDTAPVLIAGGGLVGLSAAAFLAQQGVRSLTIERLPASSGATLPRPDSFVAWTCPNVVAEPATALRAALNRSLSTRQ